MSRRPRSLIPASMMANARSLGINLSALAPTLSPGRAAPIGAAEPEPGETIVEAEVMGRAVPWKAFPVASEESPARARWKLYADWKEDVKFQTLVHMVGREPYAGLVIIDTWFYLRPIGHDPDVDNLVKAFTDGLQGSVIRNDRQKRGGAAWLAFIPDCEERVEYRVRALANNPGD